MKKLLFVALLGAISLANAELRNIQVDAPLEDLMIAKERLDLAQAFRDHIGKHMDESNTSALATEEKDKKVKAAKRKFLQSRDLLPKIREKFVNNVNSI